MQSSHKSPDKKKLKENKSIVSLLFLEQDIDINSIDCLLIFYHFNLLDMDRITENELKNLKKESNNLK